MIVDCSHMKEPPWLVYHTCSLTREVGTLSSMCTNKLHKASFSLEDAVCLSLSPKPHLVCFITSSITENGQRLRSVVPQITSQELMAFQTTSANRFFLRLLCTTYLNLPLNHIFTCLSYTQVDLQVHPLLNCSLLYLLNQ